MCFLFSHMVGECTPCMSSSVVENQLDLTRVSPPNKSVQGLNIRYYGSNYSVIADGHSLSAHEDSQNKKIFLNSVNCVIQS